MISENKQPKPALESELNQQLLRVDKLSKMLDSNFKLPGTNIKFGYDAVLGLVPVVGDTLSLLISSYILFIAYRCKVKKRTIARMLGNIMRDYIIGLVPIVGDIFDVTSKANLKNARLLAKALDTQVNTTKPNP